MLKQAIYVVCNLASPGVDMHKNAVIASAIPPHLLYYMVCTKKKGERRGERDMIY